MEFLKHKVAGEPPSAREIVAKLALVAFVTAAGYSILSIVGAIVHGASRWLR